jgi:DNA-binding NtrC family response regulator
MTIKPRILVIDDDRTIRESLVLVLEEEGFSVDTAENGQEGIVKSFNNFYDVAIVDWRLPDIEGTKLLGKLKQTTPKMGKIMLTGYPSINNAIEALNEKADAFFLKPANIEMLIEKIRQILKEQNEHKKLLNYVTKAMEIAEVKK